MEMAAWPLENTGFILKLPLYSPFSILPHPCEERDEAYDRAREERRMGQICREFLFRAAQNWQSALSVGWARPVKWRWNAGAPSSFANLVRLLS